ncbi:hypothetical protein THMA_0685 [Thermotoga maritima MSB8]|uniref:Uncharacterized protein n=1 Tax=Thermotoga maritima (strain ATCC 43589 / DSM 3109 / JCM 10099 / NBRC 100826 / MSB8) TaxID=243274 RepID=Q9WZD8_THEMA|nr:hypothetical protein [Thermotoga maritima]AAD35752.1 hypothetical protein TM_0670 [Thermotoga maritima MSB8]AGL49595.1 hypothetical protein Tmari_0670 [Thermotoga maritima MSB8]AHD17576.1 hypothetical protein THEMA_01315 [Thermotoga maritima MSB8]AKE26590.1 hypothetical protein THMC_0685 [Thermotoga maritima]AKE28455.1 hypothetical protein THMA_0685 [Thermotoga maritima MSB8]
MDRIPVIKRSGEVLYIDRKSIKSYVDRFLSSQSDEQYFYVSDLKISSSGKRYRVEIVLKDPHGKIFSGESEGPRTSRNLLKLIGEAATEAFNRAFHKYDEVSVDDIKEVALAGRRFVFAHLTFLKNGKESWRIGAAPLEKDLLQSVVFAVIDALVK